MGGKYNTCSSNNNNKRINYGKASPANILPKALKEIPEVVLQTTDTAVAKLTGNHQFTAQDVGGSKTDFLIYGDVITIAENIHAPGANITIHARVIQTHADVTINTSGSPVQELGTMKANDGIASATKGGNGAEGTDGIDTPIDSLYIRFGDSVASKGGTGGDGVDAGPGGSGGVGGNAGEILVAYVDTIDTKKCSCRITWVGRVLIEKSEELAVDHGHLLGFKKNYIHPDYYRYALLLWKN